MIRYLPPLIAVLAAIAVLAGVALGARIYRWEVFMWGVAIIGLAIAHMSLVSANRHLTDANATRAETIRIYEDMHR